MQLMIRWPGDGAPSAPSAAKELTTRLTEDRVRLGSSLICESHNDVQHGSAQSVAIQCRAMQGKHGSTLYLFSKSRR